MEIVPAHNLMGSTITMNTENHVRTPDDSAPGKGLPTPAGFKYPGKLADLVGQPGLAEDGPKFRSLIDQDRAPSTGHDTPGKQLSPS